MTQPRPFVIEDTEAIAKGSTQRGEVVWCRRYLDTTLHDRLLRLDQITPEQHDAAEALYRLFCAAGLNVRVVARFGTAGGSNDADEDNPPDEALGRYRTILGQLNAMSVLCLEALMHGQWLGMQRMPATRDALDWLASLEKTP